MGFFDDDIIEEVMSKFIPLDLNEGNVQAIFHRCRKPNADGNADFDGETLKKNRAEIRYLLGQLALVHEGVKEHELNAAFCKRYDGKVWTTDSAVLIDLLNLGIDCHFCAYHEQDEKIELKLDEIKPTLSPKDAGFAAWWQTSAGLLVQAQAAKDEGRLGEALSFYEQTANLGDAKAQLNCGAMYHKGEGTAKDKDKDKDKALYWYEKAALQGEDVAKYMLQEYQTEAKAMQGDAEAQYAYANKLRWSDMARAFTFYLEAARQGHKEAQYEVGIFCAFGRGTEKDSDEALKWFQASAKQEHDKASFFSALMCKKGLFGTKAADLEAELSKLIDRYDTLSENEIGCLINIYSDLSDDLKNKFNHAQADSLRKLARTL